MKKKLMKMEIRFEEEDAKSVLFFNNKIGNHIY